MKANNRALKGGKFHSLSGEYKIPYNDRMRFIHQNIKWVGKSKYMDYVRWKNKQMGWEK